MKTSAPKPQDGILDIDIYVGGKGHVAGVANSVKLSSNENPLGPSPRAREAIVKAAERVNIYPSSDHAEIREAIAQRFDLEPDRIIMGNGSDEVISFVTQAFCGPGDEVIFTEHGFSLYRICALAAGATPVEVAEKDRHTDIDAILEALSAKTKIIFIANPNNPTGTFIPLAEIERLLDAIPSDVLLMLDGAYAEFVEGYDGGAALTDRYDNLLMSRTFSKIFGLGGLRLGWGYGSSHLIEILSRVRGPFNVNAAALAAGQAALSDRDYFETSLAVNAKGRAFLQEALAKIGIPSDPSFGNFILARFASEAEADAADLFLQQNGIIIRAVKSYKLPHCLRITVGKFNDCKRIVSLLSEFKEARP